MWSVTIFCYTYVVHLGAVSELSKLIKLTKIHFFIKTLKASVIVILVERDYKYLITSMLVLLNTWLTISVSLIKYQNLLYKHKLCLIFTSSLVNKVKLFT